MPNKNFELINPYIEGSFKTIFTGANAIGAADTCFKSISSYIRNPMPSFYFTLKNMKGGKLHHFKVSEKLINGNTSDYMIAELDLNNDKSHIESLEKKIDSLKARHDDKKNNVLKGGKSKKTLDDFDDDSSSSSDSDDNEPRNYSNKTYTEYVYQPQQPILYYWYDPYIYNIPTFYTPHFSLPITPLVEINLSSAFFP
jgi:hypothetical protein